MQKELLLAIGDDSAASYNLRFLKEVYGGFCDLKLTLIYVAPFMSGWDIDENNLLPKGPGLNELYEHTKTKGERALEDAEKWIKDIVGCDGKNVTTKVVRSQRGTVGELIQEARDGLYDALLVGRKGFTWFEEMFVNSVTHTLLWGDIDFPLWICKKPPSNPRKDVLLCLDGSEASKRIVDHAGYMLAEEEQHTFTLFHVARNLHSVQAKEVFDQALDVLGEHNIDESRIELKTVKSSTPVKAVMKEATDGNYLAVGVGKHGADAPSRLDEIFPSSFTIKLLRQLDVALWVSK